jgi:hypothetical protein
LTSGTRSCGTPSRSSVPSRRSGQEPLAGQRVRQSSGSRRLRRKLRGANFLRRAASASPESSVSGSLSRETRRNGREHGSSSPSGRVSLLSGSCDSPSRWPTTRRTLAIFRRREGVNQTVADLVQTPSWLRGVIAAPTRSPESLRTVSGDYRMQLDRYRGPVNRRNCVNGGLVLFAAVIIGRRTIGDTLRSSLRPGVAGSAVEDQGSESPVGCAPVGRRRRSARSRSGRCVRQ